MTMEWKVNKLIELITSLLIAIEQITRRDDKGHSPEVIHTHEDQPAAETDDHRGMTELGEVLHQSNSMTKLKEKESCMGRIRNLYRKVTN